MFWLGDSSGPRGVKRLVQPASASNESLAEHRNFLPGVLRFARGGFHLGRLR